MEKQQFKTKNNLKYRTYYFSLDVIDILENLPGNYIFEIIGKQLLRSATSIGANVIEAQAGRTKKDFTNFYQIALKSGNETKYWLAILREKHDNKKIIDKLIDENEQLCKMLAASLLTLKNKRKNF